MQWWQMNIHIIPWVCYTLSSLDEYTLSNASSFLRLTNQVHGIRQGITCWRPGDVAGLNHHQLGYLYPPWYRPQVARKNFVDFTYTRISYNYTIIWALSTHVSPTFRLDSITCKHAKYKSYNPPPKLPPQALITLYSCVSAQGLHGFK